MKIEKDVTIMEIKVPDIGDFSEVEVIEVLVKAGDRVEVEQSVITVESDKASMEIPSSQAGVVKELKVQVGDSVSEGSVMLILEANDGGDVPAKSAVSSVGSHASSAPEGEQQTASESEAAGAGQSDAVEIKVPDLGDFDEVEVIEVLVNEGDSVQAEQSVITVESDKASMEIPAPQAGVVQELKVKLGDKVSQGTLMMLLQASAPQQTANNTPSTDNPPPKSPVTGSPAVSASKAPPVTAEAHEPAGAYVVKPHASPSVRKFARELGVDLHMVRGTGPKQRITKEDVQGFVKQAVAGVGTSPSASAAKATGVGLDLLPWPKLDFSKFGETETVELSRIQKLSGPNLHRNWVMMPHVTQFDEADITDLEQFRKETNQALAKQGVKATMLAFVIKASVYALKQFPKFNSSLSEDGTSLILKKFYNIGFAADTPNGLVVPVVKNADQKGVAEIAQEMGDLAKQAREGKLKGGDMQGASFTISSLGGVGGTAFTPIINAPEVAILGLSKSQMKPVWNGETFEPRLMLPLSLSYDHRVIDGAQAARFTTELAATLADLRRVLL